MLPRTADPARRTRVLILGGGFAGLHAAMRLEQRLAKTSEVEITLVNRENFTLFTPMLHEVAASDLDLTHIVSPIRSLLRRTRFFAGEVESMDLVRQTVTVRHGYASHTHPLPYDHLVLALGSVTNFFGLPGLEERAFTMKSLADAVQLRNAVIGHLEEADTECCLERREALLTFVVAGGGFAGVETIAALNDFVREALRCYPRLRETDLRLVLVHPGGHLLPELGEKLGRYAQQKLTERGVEVRTGCRVASVDSRHVQLSDGLILPTETLVWTAGTCPHPLVAALPCQKEHGRLVVDGSLRVSEWPNIWAVGDCASVPDPATGKACPPTAQHALRQGHLVAENIVRSLRGKPLQPFRFRTIGQLAAIGRRTGVASLFSLQFSGFLAWWLWRTVYLAKLPRLDRKIRVALDWTLDLLFSKDLVQFDLSPTRSAAGMPDRR